MEFLGNIESFIAKRVWKEPLLSNPAEENTEEKNLKSIPIKESTKRRLSEQADYYETKDRGAGVFKQGKLCQGERAAYLVDKFLRFDLVPTTVIRTIEGKEGSFQRFIPDAKTGIEVSRDSVSREEVTKMVIFDFLINNLDRQTKNFLVKGKRVVAIDNEASFLSEAYVYHPILYFGESLLSAPISKEIKNKITQLDKWSEGKKSLANSLENLLGNEKVDSFFERLKYLIKYTERGYFQTEEEYRKYEKDNKL